jgi:hypothetical protein
MQSRLCVQRLIQSPGDNRKVYGFGLVDWREGWFMDRPAPERTADVFCEQVRASFFLVLTLPGCPAI